MFTFRERTYVPAMTRHTIQVSVTVDVDDPTLVRANELRLTDAVPTAREAMGSAIVDAIADHAASPLHEQGIEFVVVALAEDEHGVDP